VTTGWDAVHRVTLEAPWDAFWLDVYDDPPTKDWYELITAVRSISDEGGVELACRAMSRLIAKHNITDRAGEPIEIVPDSLTGSLTRAIVHALLREPDEAPLVPTPSPVPSSTARKKSPRTSTSTTSLGTQGVISYTSSTPPAASLSE
jgi:hypothetical protein